jgi:hypothetical protein
MSTTKIFAGIIGILLLGWIVSPPAVKPSLIFSALLCNLFFSFFIHLQNRKIMATNEQFEALLTRIDTSTNGIAQQLRDLKDQIANQGLSKELEDAILAKLETAATKLEAVGKEDPDESIPDDTTNGNQG